MIELSLLSQSHLHHLGVAVSNLQSAVRFYEALGYSPGNVTPDSADAVDILFLTKENAPTIELVCPQNEESPVAKWIRRRGVGVYHTCFQVELLDKAIAEMREQNWVPASLCRKAPALGDRNIIFMFHQDLGVIELVEGPVNE